MKAPVAAPARPRRRTLAYGSGNFANTLATQVIGNRIQFFYVDVVGMSASRVGLVWLVYSIWNIVNDPLAGTIGDRTRSRWGRRRPFLLFGPVPLGVAFALLWMAPGDGGVDTLLWFLVTLFLYDAVYSLVTVNYNAFFAELTDDVRGRSSLAAWREALAGIALIVAFVGAPILSDELGYAAMGVVIGAIVAITYLTAFFGGRERAVDGEASVRPPFLTSLRDVFRWVPFRFFIVASICTNFLFLVIPATLPFWTKYVLGLDDDATTTLFGIELDDATAGAVLLGVPFLLVIPLLAVWNRVLPRVGARRTWMAGFLAFVPGLVVLALADSFAVGLLGTTLLAPGLAALQMSPIVLLSQVVAEEARSTGVAKEGSFFGVNGALGKAGFAIQGLLFAVVFSVSGYVNDADQQTDGALFGIRFLLAVVPLGVCLLAAAILHAMRRHQRDDVVVPPGTPPTTAVAAA